LEPKYFILVGKVAVPASLLEWAFWFQETFESRIVAKDIIGGVEISTVFIGLDMSIFSQTPELFETMIFGGEREGECHRYGTWDEAEVGHACIVEEIRATVR
jgi:hypothetical protein